MTRDTDLIRRGDAMDLRDELADVIGARPLSSIHSALSEYRKAIRALPVQEPPSPGVTAGATGGEDHPLVDQLTGRARFLRDRGEIKTPELLERAAMALTPAPVVPAEGLDALVAAAQTIIDRGYVSKSIPEEKPDHDALQSAITALRSAPPVGARVTVQEAARVLLDAIGDYDRNRGHSDYDPSLPVGDALLSALAALLPAGEGE